MTMATMRLLTTSKQGTTAISTDKTAIDKTSTNDAPTDNLM